MGILLTLLILMGATQVQDPDIEYAVASIRFH
jgi:hypothetical protein